MGKPDFIIDLSVYLTVSLQAGLLRIQFYTDLHLFGLELEDWNLLGSIYFKVLKPMQTL